MATGPNPFSKQDIHRGRPVVRHDVKRHRRNACLADDDIATAKDLGDGNISKGIRIALSFAAANRNKFVVYEDMALPASGTSNDDYPFDKWDVIVHQGRHYRVIENYGLGGQVQELSGDKAVITLFYWDTENEKAVRI